MRTGARATKQNYISIYYISLYEKLFENGCIYIYIYIYIYILLHKKTVLVKKLLFYKLNGCKNTAF